MGLAGWMRACDNGGMGISGETDSRSEGWDVCRAE